MSSILTCALCAVQVHEPYIRCAECVDYPKICLYCFSKGAEGFNHQSNHQYNVIVSTNMLRNVCFFFSMVISCFDVIVLAE